MSDDPRSDALDGLRIRRLAAARKAAYRARSHSVIAAVACLVLAAQLIWQATRGSAGIALTRGAVACGLIAICAVAAAGYFFSHARRLHREAAESALPEPTTPPDFSTLSDGSQRWKDLENIE
jgi:hypothetical protein